MGAVTPADRGMQQQSDGSKQRDDQIGGVQLAPDHHTRVPVEIPLPTRDGNERPHCHVVKEHGSAVGSDPGAISPRG